jgi:hypothetical protein
VSTVAANVEQGQKIAVVSCWLLPWPAVVDSDIDVRIGLVCDHLFFFSYYVALLLGVFKVFAKPYGNW